MALRMFLVEEALREERLERRRNRRRLRDSFNTNLVPDLEFVANYRLSRTLYEELCQDIVPLLPRKRNRRAIEPATKVFLIYKTIVVFVVYYVNKYLIISNIITINHSLILDTCCLEFLRSGQLSRLCGAE